MSNIFTFNRKIGLVVVILLAGIMLNACDSTTTTKSSEESSSIPSPSSSTIVAPLFREYYERLGGEGVLGKVISPLQDDGQKQKQYTESALMVFDPRAPAAKRFQLADLGNDLGISEPDLPIPEDNDPQYVRGHYLTDDFFNKFNELGGLRTAGEPLTELHYDADTTRYQQFFENVGLYRLESDPPGTVHLLAYGAWHCGTLCTASPDANAIVEPLPPLVAPFKDVVKGLGTDFTGFALTPPGFSDDGKVEQVFENIVLMIDFADPSRVQVRPMLERIGRLPDLPVAKSDNPQMYFYPVDGDLGYNVPRTLLDYIGRHGGLEVSGAPISEFQPLNGEIYRQCFKNLCLEQDANGVIRPSSLGATYKTMHQPIAQAAQTIQEEMQTQEAPTEVVQVSPTQTPLPAASLQAAASIPPEESDTAVGGEINMSGNLTAGGEIALQVWVSFPTISPDGQQEIGASILSNGAPLADATLQLFVTMPDGYSWTSLMPPTSAVGQTQLILPAIKAANGTLIPYRVCLSAANSYRFCVRDNFLIWTTD